MTAKLRSLTISILSCFKRRNMVFQQTYTIQKILSDRNGTVPLKNLALKFFDISLNFYRKKGKGYFKNNDENFEALQMYAWG